jgi:hypothetical protein
VTRRHVPLLGAAAALVLALVLALVARDVRLWEQSVADGDRSFQVTPGPDGLWEPQSRKLPGIGRALLAVDDDLELRRAAQLFRRSRPRTLERRTTADLAEATAAQVAFSEIQRGGGARRLRSIAANQLGILALVDALSDPSEAEAGSRKSVQKFTEAIRLDPSNQEAMRNLELVFTLIRASDPRIDPEGVTFRSGGAGAGAGSSSRGSGF